MNSSHFARAALALISCLAIAGAAHATRYRVTPMENSDAGTSYGAAINNQGQVAGYTVASTNPARYLPLRIEQGGRAAMLQEPGDDPATRNGLGWGLNDLGQVVGKVTDASGDHPFLATGKRMQRLNTPNGMPGSASAVNNAGLVVGTESVFGRSRAFSVSAQGVAVTLPVLADTYHSVAAAVNDAGRIAGTVGSGSGTQSNAVYWQDGVVHVLPSLGGSGSSAAAVNARGVVVGTSSLPGQSGGYPRAALFDGDTAVDLQGSVPGVSWATGINATGVVVGNRDHSIDPSVRNRAVVVLPTDGVMRDLQDLLVKAQRGQWTLTNARAINDKGVIIATGTFAGDGVTRAVRITPVQIPSSE